MTTTYGMYTYYAPAIFEVTDELLSEIQIVIIELDPFSLCRVLITAMTRHASIMPE